MTVLQQNFLHTNSSVGRKALLDGPQREVRQLLFPQLTDA